MMSFELRRLLLAVFLLCLALPSALARAQEGGGAVLDIKPMRMEEKAPAPSVVLPAPAQPPKGANIGKNLRIESDPQQDPMWWMNGIYAKLSPSLRDELAGKAQKAQRFCDENYMLGNFYDCECYGMAVLKDLVLQGGVSKDIAFNIADERFEGCVDTAKIAGFAYNRCQQSLMLLQITDRTLEDVCSCAARGLARIYMRNPVANMDEIDRTYNELLVECRHNPVSQVSSPPATP